LRGRDRVLGRVVVALPHLPRTFAEEFARRVGGELVEASSKTFPDGEAYVRIEGSLEGSTAYILFTGFPEPSQRLVEAMLAVEAARGLGASRVVAVAAYMPYARQDRRFLRGEPVSVRAALYSLASAGAEALVAVDIHKPASLQWFPGPAANVSPAPAFAEVLHPLVEGRDRVYIVAPDRGALERAKRLASLMGLPFDYLEKARDRVTGEVTVKPKTLDVKGATVILVDDIVSTGGTIAKAAELLYRQGAETVMVAATHGLFVGNALEKIRRAGITAIVVADTVNPQEDTIVARVGGLAAEEALKVEAELGQPEQQ
jgi:ribose-phosphate pyrophosphokinase